MQRGKRMMLGVGLLVALAVWATPAQAQRMEVVFKDAAWGAGLGALFGASQLFFFDNPDEEVHRIGQGIAFGVFIGAGFGFIEASQTEPRRSFATYDVQANRLTLQPPGVDYNPRLRMPTLPLFEARF